VGLWRLVARASFHIPEGPLVSQGRKKRLFQGRFRSAKWRFSSSSLYHPHHHHRQNRHYYRYFHYQLAPRNSSGVSLAEEEAAARRRKTRIKMTELEEEEDSEVEVRDALCNSSHAAEYLHRAAFL
jgi:hypothetical protein